MWIKHKYTFFILKICGKWTTIRLISISIIIVYSFINDINTTHNIKKVWRYQRGNQKWPIKSHQSKDRQYNGEKVNDKQWSTTHYTEN